jgi:hypothetical protein
MAAGELQRAGGRAEIEEAIAQRATHLNAEDVSRTVSLANGERLFGHEYHGRFLIELLQNAADAWDAGASEEERSRVEVVIADGPVLLVANEGAPFPTSVVIKSLGHIGRSTKAEGKAIGHKCIGFKSVLEMSAMPEIYSGFGSAEPGLAVRFDPRKALERIHGASPRWPELAAEHIGEAGGDELALVPVLQFPIWVDHLPEEVTELAGRGFETVIRIPFSTEPRKGRAPDQATWLSAVRAAADRISDEMLLLLGAFRELTIEDRTSQTRRVIRPEWGPSKALAEDTTREEVTVSHDEGDVTRWLLYRQKLPDFEDRAGEACVGVRLGDDPARPVIAPTGEEPSAPFYLFFPTKIRSGLPFLLHGYFEVNAARTDFYEGATQRNGTILKALAWLVETAVEDLAMTGDAGLASLLDLLGDAPEPNDELARAFRNRTLDLLDEIAWVPLQGEETDIDRAKPTDVLADDDANVIVKLREAFPAPYVRRRTGLGLAASGVGPSGNRFLVSRHRGSARSTWQVIGELCQPGAPGPWASGDEEIGFLALLELSDALRVKDAGAAHRLLGDLRGDEQSVLIPVTAGSAGLRMVPMPDPSEGVAGRRSRGVMARVQKATSTDAEPLVPPAALDLDFVPDGLLASEREIDDAKAFGIRPFTVGNILDRLTGATEREAQPGEIARFLWRLLGREQASEFSLASAAVRAREFDPADWFWPIGGRQDRERQSRLRSLALVRLPAHDGSWQAAETLAFGADWAAAIEAASPPSPVRDVRCAAYNALERVKPGDWALIASPERLFDELGRIPGNEVVADDAMSEMEWLHIFLLRLGVWETLPVEAFDDASQANRERFPWRSHPRAAERERQLALQSWVFGEHWSGGEHRNVWVQRDFRLRWNLADAAARDATATARLLDIASDLYRDLPNLTVFCPKCPGHTARRTSDSSAGYPSLLAIELRGASWVPVVRDGARLDAPASPSSVWWAPSVPTGAALSQSPLRFLSLCDPEAEIGAQLRELVSIERVEDAQADSILKLLDDLQGQFEAEGLTPNPLHSSSARRGFIALHRLAYERLGDFTAGWWSAGATGDPEQIGEAASVNGELDVLCEIGDTLGYRPATSVFHDDGSFASYRRYFGQLPFAQLAKEKLPIAERLGVRRFEVDLHRRPTGEAADVTNEIAEFLANRIPELLAILVHHVLAGQTLDPDGPDFRTRARRLQQLRVAVVDDLVIEARVTGTDAAATIGEHSEGEVFLEGAASMNPILYHDLSGEGWRDALRRRLAPHLARIVERPDYADVFALFLLDDTDVQREATLLDRGITQADVDAIRAAVGLVSKDERRAHRLWFGAIAAVAAGRDAPSAVSGETIAITLESSGFSSEEAARLIDRGGGEQVRRDTGPGGALAQLSDHEINLRTLDVMLRAAGDEGLHIRVGDERLRSWTTRYARAAAAVLAEPLGQQQAKEAAARWRAPAAVAYALDPAPHEWLTPVIDSLRDAGFEPDPEALASDAEPELVRIAGVAGRAELRERTEDLYDEEQRRQILVSAAVAWRRQLAFLGVLVRTSGADSRASIRRRAEEVDELLPARPSSPLKLRTSLAELLPGHAALAGALSDRLTDSVAAPGADREAILTLTAQHGVETRHADLITRALQAPRRELARRVRESIAAIEQDRLSVTVPLGLAPAPMSQPKSDGPRSVATVKVDGSVDRRKRELGDRAERWALAAMIKELKDLDVESRRRAIDSLLGVLERFQGDSVEAVRAHAEAARAPDLDDDELIEELAGFLHVAAHSDAFGFDMLGWIADLTSGRHRPMLIEVKSSADGTFQLSPNEWRTAEASRSGYGVLAVRRAGASGNPQSLDLLVDPVGLVDSGLLSRDPDGYVLRYATGRGSPDATHPLHTAG